MISSVSFEPKFQFPFRFCRFFRFSFESLLASHDVFPWSCMFYKHYAIDIADPSSMQDACHRNFVIDLAHRSLCGSMVEHRSVESEGLRFDSLWGLRIFSLSHARDKTKNIFLYFFGSVCTILSRSIVTCLQTRASLLLPRWRFSIFCLSQTTRNTSCIVKIAPERPAVILLDL